MRKRIKKEDTKDFKSSAKPFDSKKRKSSERPFPKDGEGFKRKFGAKNHHYSDNRNTEGFKKRRSSYHRHDSDDLGRKGDENRFKGYPPKVDKKGNDSSRVPFGKSKRYNDDRRITDQSDGRSRSVRSQEKTNFRSDQDASSLPGYKKFGKKRSNLDKTIQKSLDRQVGSPTPPRLDTKGFKSKIPSKVLNKTDSNKTLEEIRLNKYIANAGLCSRREADELIAGGMIKVNGKVVTEMGYKVKLNDTVKYGKDLLSREKMMYVLLNKPKDFITTMDDPQERRTVMELVAGACHERIYPVGRLDRNTTGLLLLTNDGELTEKLTHPRSDVSKIYQAELDKPITEEDFETLKVGVELEDGFIKPDELAIVTPDAFVVGIKIHSGKNRVVRRMFAHLGYEVMKLDRTTFSGLTKKDLPRGKWRFLNEKEIIRLKYLI